MARQKLTYRPVRVGFVITEEEQQKLKTVMNYLKIKFLHEFVDYCLEAENCCLLEEFDKLNVHGKIDDKATVNRVIYFSQEIYDKLLLACRLHFRPQQNMFRYMINGAYEYYRIWLD